MSANSDIPPSSASSPLPVQTILFDIGNVLLKFDFDRAARAMAPHCTVPAAVIRTELDSWQHRHETGAANAESFSAGVREAIGFSGAEEQFRDIFCDIFEPNEPMWKFARSCFGKVPVYLFSNISYWHEMWVFAKYPDFARFDGGFYSWRIGAMKPDRRFYQAALDSLPCDPARVGYMDDMPHNVAGGEAAGFRSFKYDYHDHTAFLNEAARWLPEG